MDVVSRRIFPGTIAIKNGKIAEITKDTKVYSNYILPGLIDAHVHIESSMLVPSEFARIAVVHGTTAVVSDPHEIANVAGMEGVRFMIENGKKVPFRFYFGAPSCVPATPFETSGNILGAKEVEEMLSWEEVRYLSEMMNYPAVINEDAEVKKKLQAAIIKNRPIDGHAPGLRGKDAKKYVAAGISTDHECYTLDEAREKASLGMKVLIREGSAARNFDELLPLLNEHPHMVMFCSDDKHPDDLIEGHINKLIKTAIERGYDVLDVVSACTLNPTLHYGLDAGLLQEGDNADFIIVNSLESMAVLESYVGGMRVAQNGKTLIATVEIVPVNRFYAHSFEPYELEINAEGEHLNVIEAIDGQIVTKKLRIPARIESNKAVSDVDNDLLKIIVINRYNKSNPAIGFIKGFGLKKGAIASTVAHDSHNIIALGVDDASLAHAINTLIEHKGGIALSDGQSAHVLPLPVGGLMALDDAYTVADGYRALDTMAKNFGCSLSAPYMTLSFMALLVIPEIKLSDKGLFDGAKFEFIPLFSEH